MKKVMYISSVGGHLTQLLELKKIFNNYNYVLVTEKTDVTKPMKDKYNIEYLPYGSRNQKLIYIFILLWSCIKSLFYFIKYQVGLVPTFAKENMGVPEGKRKESKIEFERAYDQIYDDCFELVRINFGGDKKLVERYSQQIKQISDKLKKKRNPAKN